MEPSSSPAFSLNTTDLYKILRGAAVVAIGAGLTAILDAVPFIDFGAYTPVVTALSSSLVEAVRRFVADYSA